MKKALALIAVSLIFAAMFNGCRQEQTPPVVTEVVSTTAVTEVTEVVTEAEITTEVQQNDRWATAYKEYLLTALEKDYEEDYLRPEYFTLRYIDNDDIPELLLNNGFDHASSVTLVTFFNGEIREYKELGSFGQIMFKEKENEIACENRGMGYYYPSAYHLEDGILATDWEGRRNAFDLSEDSEYEYFSNGREVSYEKFEKDLKKYMPDWYVSDLESPKEVYAFDENAVRLEPNKIENFFKNR